MISPELIRRYSFFAGLSVDDIKTLADAAEIIDVDSNHVFFQSGDGLDRFYIVVEGEVGITIQTTAHEVEHGVADQLMGTVATEDILISTVSPGQIFGWSSLLPPYTATAGAKATKTARVIGFDARTLLERFEEEPRFGYRMARKLARVIHDRLRDRWIESLDRVME